jgi:uncharacterized protein YaaQ
MTSPNINQLVIVIAGAQAGELMHRLGQERYYYTKIDSAGGLIQEPNVTLLIGLNETRLGPLLDLVRKVCQPYRQFIPAHVSVHPMHMQPAMIEAEMGGATVYVLDVERFEPL